MSHDGTLTGDTVRDPVETRPQRVPVRSQDDGPVVEERTGREQRGSGADGVDAGPSRQELVQPRGLAAHGCRTPGAEHIGHRRFTGDRRSGRRLDRGGGRRPRRAGQDDMAVGPAHAEGAHAGQPLVGRVAPVGEFRLDAQSEFREGYAGIRLLEVQARRKLAVPDRQYCLEQPGDTRGALQVADVRLGRPHGERCVVRPPGGGHRAQRGGLDRVADLGAGAVQLDVLHPARLDARPLVRHPQDGLLRRHVGGGETVARPVVVHRAAADHAVHRVAVGQCLLQGLQDDEATALAPDVTIGPLVEGVTAPVGRQSAELRGGDRAVGCDVQVHPTGQRQFGFTRSQALAGQVHGDERGGLGGVHDEAGTPQPQRVRHAVRDEATAQADHGVVVDALQTLLLAERRVVGADRAGEDADVCFAQRVGHHTGVLQSFPAEFEHEPLLRVHGRGLAGGDAEEFRVEVADVLQEAAPA
ncbi:hypothetical protein GCM10010294_58130 [Streptomyces griseoloalbus]|nr:hypothetical protein GCM10010294_58130 [Streptomyces griseoloalbus]